jgi:hypothetical protein
VRPTFVLDYPVSSTPEAYEFIRDLHGSGVCEIGAHLQPWDTPPLVEPMTDENSYPGNLPFELEREKLLQLTGTIEKTSVCGLASTRRDDMASARQLHESSPSSVTKST